MRFGHGADVMSQSTISAELVRELRRRPPSEAIDHRDPKLPGFVLRARPSGVHSWRVQLANRRWLTLGRLEEVSLADARAAAQVRRAQAALGEAIPRRNPSSDMTLRKFLDETYEPWMKATYGKRTTQVERIRSGFRDLLDLKLSEFTTARIDRWRTTRKYRNASADAPASVRSRELSHVTINNNIAALRAALNRATEWRIIEAMPLGKIKRRAADENAIVRYLSSDEEARLRSALSVRDERRRAGRESANAWRRERGHEAFPSYGRYTDHLMPLVLLALNTGLRRGELLRLRWRDVDLDRRMLTVRGEDAKTGQTRHVPLNSEAVAVMTVWRPIEVDRGAYVFVSGDESKALTYIRKAWVAVLTAATIDGFRFHDLRHTFASKLVMAGVDLNTVRELLGHKSVAMTLRYAHLAPEHKAAAVETLVARRSEAA
jgi:integrase